MGPWVWDRAYRVAAMSTTDGGADPSTSGENRSEPVAADPTPVRLGEVGGGAMATARPGGSVEVRREGAVASFAWWVGAEDRWHVPAGEASLRERRLDGAPVLESTVRIPSGDAVGVVTCARVGGLNGAAIDLRVTNGSPVPVSLAFVVNSPAPMRVSSAGIAVPGAADLLLTRPGLGFVVADTEAGLLAALGDNEIDPAPPTGPVTGWVAVLVPLPHTAVATAVVHLGADSGGAAAPGPDLVDRDRVPSVERVLSGWANHLHSAPRIDWPRIAADLGSHAEAVSDLLIGTDEEASLELRAEVAEGRGLLGWTKDPGELIALAAAQHRTGRLRCDDPVRATAAFLRATAAWWSAGMSRSLAEDLIGPVAAAGHWLARGRRRPSVAGLEVEMAAAISSAVTMLADLGQPEVAEDFHSMAAALDAAGAAAAPSGVRVSPRSDAGESAANRGVAASCARIRRFHTAAVSETVGGLELAPGWDLMDAGVDLEVHELPTRFGTLSYGIRWHGERPALLWELSGRGDEALGAAPIPTAPTLTVSAIDPAWSASETSGEALLAAPQVPIHVSAPPKSQVVTRDGSRSLPERDVPEPPEGATFS